MLFLGSSRAQNDSKLDVDTFTNDGSKTAFVGGIRLRFFTHDINAHLARPSRFAKPPRTATIERILSL